MKKWSDAPFLGYLHPAGAQNKTLISDTACLADELNLTRMPPLLSTPPPPLPQIIREGEKRKTLGTTVLNTCVITHSVNRMVNECSVFPFSIK